MRKLRREKLGGGGRRRGWMWRSGGGGDDVNDGVVNQTLDLRGMGVHGVDPNFFGNGCALVVSRLPPPPPATIGEGGGGDQAAAGAMARAVRATVNECRTPEKLAEFRGSVLALATANSTTQLKAAVSSVAGP